MLLASILDKLGEPRLSFRLLWFVLQKRGSSFLACAGIEHWVVVADWIVVLNFVGVLLHTKENEDNHFGDFLRWIKLDGSGK